MNDKATPAGKPGRLYPDRPIVACLAVVKRGDRVLIARRSVPPTAGKWGFPGGMQELAETVQNCAQRELLEETGILAEPLRVLTAFDTIRHDAENKVSAHFTLVCVLLDWKSGEGEPLEDADQLGWFTLAEAEKLDRFPDTLPLMKLAFAS